jgi:hypothetical protein
LGQVLVKELQYGKYRPLRLWPCCLQWRMTYLWKTASGMLLDFSRDESLDHEKLSDHKSRIIHYELCPVRSTTLEGQMGPGTITVKWKWYI